MMAKIHINIGSNIGDRASLIESAVAAVAERIDPDGRALIRLSPVIESEPWGYDSDRMFYNLGLMIETPAGESVDAKKLLDDLLDVEAQIASAPHRTPDGAYADRPIDIDLIAVDDMIIDIPHLQLPHPRMHLRAFVLQPVATLDPQWRHPETGLTAAEMMAQLS